MRLRVWKDKNGDWFVGSFGPFSSRRVADGIVSDELKAVADGIADEIEDDFISDEFKAVADAIADDIEENFNVDDLAKVIVLVRKGDWVFLEFVSKNGTSTFVVRNIRTRVRKSFRNLGEAEAYFYKMASDKDPDPEPDGGAALKM